MADKNRLLSTIENAYLNLLGIAPMLWTGQVQARLPRGSSKTALSTAAAVAVAVPSNPMFCSISPSICPRSPDYPASATMCGERVGPPGTTRNVAWMVQGRTIDAAQLRNAIDAAQQSPIRLRASEIGRRMREGHGLAAAVAAIEEHSQGMGIA